MSKVQESGQTGSPPPMPDPLPLSVVDNHTHLDISRDGGPAPNVAVALAAATAVGVDRIVQIGCDLVGARFIVEQVDRHPQMLGGVAIHPNKVPKHASRGDLTEAYIEIERIAAHPRVRIIGETGLDYFRTGLDGVQEQQNALRWHIDLAKRTGKALQIHDRDAHDDVMRILQEEGSPEHTVMHCFSGDENLARNCVAEGYFLSFSGTVTFKNAREVRNALAVTPLDHLLVETDAPYLTPSPYRGASNASYLLPLTVRAMAAVLAVDMLTLCRALSNNSERVYGSWQ